MHHTNTCENNNGTSESNRENDLNDEEKYTLGQIWDSGYSERKKQKLRRFKRISENSLNRSIDSSQINIYQLQFGYEKKTISIIESFDTLQTATPFYSAVANVIIPPLQKNTCVILGWVQVLTYGKCISYYGKEGIMSGEIPALDIGNVSMVNDGSGEPHESPWYGFDECLILEGPIEHPTKAIVKMIDCPSVKTTWSLSVAGYTDDPRLTYYYRKLRFYSHLVLHDPLSKNFKVLKKITWGLEYAVDVNPDKLLGKRVRRLGPCKLEKPVLMSPDAAPILESSGVNPPVCNDAVIDVWRPFNADPHVATDHDYDDEIMSRYLALTRDYGFELKIYNKKSFLLLQQNLLNTHKLLHGRSVENGRDDA